MTNTVIIGKDIQKMSWWRDIRQSRSTNYYFKSFLIFPPDTKSDRQKHLHLIPRGTNFIAQKKLFFSIRNDSYWYESWECLFSVNWYIYLGSKRVDKSTNRYIHINTPIHIIFCDIFKVSQLERMNIEWW